jgi:uncharacterized protein (TIGR03382 family)
MDQLGFDSHSNTMLPQLRESIRDALIAGPVQQLNTRRMPSFPGTTVSDRDMDVRDEGTSGPRGRYRLAKSPENDGTRLAAARRMRSTWLIISSASLALSAPRLADACSPPPCWPGAFVPGDQARVPANVPALYWRPMSGVGITVMPENVTLASTAAPTVPIAFTAQRLANGDYLLVPDVPLVEGSSYRLTDHSKCGLGDERGPEVTFSVGPDAALPSSLGTLSAAPSAVGQMNLATTSGSCFSEATVSQAPIELVASPAAAAWMDVLHFETLVDGRPWHYATVIGAATPPGTSPSGRARDRVFEICDAKDPGIGEGLAAGAHVVTMQATLPGSAQVVMSSSLQVTLACDPGDDPDEPGEPDKPDSRASGCSTGGSSAAPWVVLALFALVRRRSAVRGRR